MKKERAKRAPLSLLPTVGHVEEGRDAYVSLNMLRRLQGDAVRWWSFHGAPTTLEISGKRYVKCLDRFTSHTEREHFLELVREYASHGVARPSGYSDVFHAKFRSPCVPWSVNAVMAPAFAGGWQQALKPGAHVGRYYKYDMRSAYLWAGSLGLPDTRTFRRTERINPDTPGLFRVRLKKPVPTAPYPFNFAREVLATSEEIETYSLPVVTVVDGVRWTDTADPARMLDAIRAVSTWKEAGRMYWGRWAQTTRVQCHTRNTEWALPSIQTNIPWAHLIVSRVRMKLWNYSADALHVFVDSVITPHMIPTGDAIGDWKLERVYDNGVLIRAPGQYGDLSKPYLDRCAGVSRLAPIRAVC